MQQYYFFPLLLGTLFKKIQKKMFSFLSADNKSPARSSVVSSRDGSPNALGESSVNMKWNASRGTSVASSCVSVGVKSKEIRNLKLELEFRDHRITELEAAYVDLQREADFKHGDMEGKLEQHQVEVGHMEKKHEDMQHVISKQATQLEEVTAQVAKLQQALADMLRLEEVKQRVTAEIKLQQQQQPLPEIQVFQCPLEVVPEHTECTPQEKKVPPMVVMPPSAPVATKPTSTFFSRNSGNSQTGAAQNGKKRDCTVM